MSFALAPGTCGGSREGVLVETDVPTLPTWTWYSCAIASLDVDVLAIQEVVDYDHDRLLIDKFLRGLNSHTQADWRIALQSCGAPNSLHVSFLWRADRVRLSGLSDVASLNGASASEAEPCAGSLRPGLYAKATSLASGEFLHIVNVHLDSWTSAKDYGTRRRAIGSIQRTITDLSSTVDAYCVVLGDFNTMGRTQGRRVESRTEIEVLDEEVSPKLTRVESQTGSTYLYRGTPFAIDHVLVSPNLVGRTVWFVHGYCRDLDGRKDNREPDRVLIELSDHCPRWRR